MQSIADLGMGERFRDLARQITLDVHGVLSGMLCHSAQLGMVVCVLDFLGL